MFKFPPPTIELTKKKSLFHKSIPSPNDLFLFIFIFFGLRNNVLTIEKFFFLGENNWKVNSMVFKKYNIIKSGQGR